VNLYDPALHEDDGHGGCVICHFYVPHTDGEMVVQQWPCAIVREAHRQVAHYSADPLDRLMLELRDEVGRARAKHSPMNSPHEGYAVMREELETELFVGHVCRDTGRSPGARHEALQVAAMGLRYILDLIDESPAERRLSESAVALNARAAPDPTTRDEAPPIG